MPPRTSYVQRAGASIAYQVFGEGPTVVMLPSAPPHLDLMWIDPGYTQVLRRLASFARIVNFDTRGWDCQTLWKHSDCRGGRG